MGRLLLSIFFSAAALIALYILAPSHIKEAVRTGAAQFIPSSLQEKVSPLLTPAQESKDALIAKLKGSVTNTKKFFEDALKHNATIEEVASKMVGALEEAETLIQKLEKEEGQSAWEDAAEKPDAKIAPESGCACDTGEEQ